MGGILAAAAAYGIRAEGRDRIILCSVSYNVAQVQVRVSLTENCKWEMGKRETSSMIAIHYTGGLIGNDAWCNLQVKLCDPCLSALEVVTTMRYTNRQN